MRIVRWTVLAVAVAATAACSGGEGDESGGDASTEQADGSGGSVPAEVESAVVERITALDGLLGETPSEPPKVLSAEEFNEGTPEEQSSALEERGFEAGAYQSLAVPETTDAIRVVLRFETEEGAEEDVASGAEDLPGEAVTKTFDVPGVPGARGFDVYGRTGLVGRNIAFSVGRYEYLLGFAAEAPPSKDQPTRAEFAEVAAQWHDEVADLP